MGAESITFGRISENEGSPYTMIAKHPTLSISYPVYFMTVDNDTIPALMFDDPLCNSLVDNPGLYLVVVKFEFVLLT
jgi:hypothetical protein